MRTRLSVLLVMAVVAGVAIYRSEFRRPVSPVERAITTARERRRYLMVEFAASWCSDCKALSGHFNDPPTREYLKKHFDLITVDVGEFDKNLDVARSLGADISQGIPAAVFFAPDGTRIGATNGGELASAASFGADQILGFLQQVVEERRVNKLVK